MYQFNHYGRYFKLQIACILYEYKDIDLFLLGHCSSTSNHLVERNPMKHFIIHILTTLSFNLFFLLLPAFAELDAHSFITTIQDDNLTKSEQTIDYPSDPPPHIFPFIEKVEIRAGLNELDPETQTQTYQLRIFPKAWGETRYSRRLLDTLVKGDTLDQTYYLGNALKERYHLVLEYIQSTDLLKTYKTLEIVYSDLINVLQQQSATNVVNDIVSFIDAEDKLTKLQLKIIDHENRLTGVEAAINKIAGNKTSINFKNEDIIKISKIAAVIDKIDPKIEDSNVYLERSKFKSTLTESELELEQAKSHDYISFFQVSYDVDEDKEDWDRRTSFEVGFKLPFINVNNEEIWQKRKALKKEKSQYEQEKAKNLKTTFQLLREQEKLLAQFELLKRKHKDGKAADALNKQLAMEGADPVDLLKLKESILENDIRITELNFLIRTNFIELLDLTGRLTRAPLTDYLSNNLRKIL
ncbi:MAG: hypothetical protein PVI90_09200 [Desulfobacteraceae bacterium]